MMQHGDQTLNSIIKTYLTNGSHACVNMPHGCAKQLYNLITSNIYVYVFE